MKKLMAFLLASALILPSLLMATPGTARAAIKTMLQPSNLKADATNVFYVFYVTPQTSGYAAGDTMTLDFDATSGMDLTAASVTFDETLLDPTAVAIDPIQQTITITFPAGTNWLYGVQKTIQVSGVTNGPANANLSFRVYSPREPALESVPMHFFGPFDHFTLDNIPASVQADRPFTVTVTARDALGSVVNDYYGQVVLTTDDPYVSPDPLAPVGFGTTLTFQNITGQVRQDVTFRDAGTHTINVANASDPSTPLLATPATVTVSAGIPNSLKIVPSMGTVTAFQPFDVAVYFLDEYSQTVSDSSYDATTITLVVPNKEGGYHVYSAKPTNGVAVFLGVSSDLVGTQTLTASDSLFWMRGETTIDVAPLGAIILNVPEQIEVGTTVTLSGNVVDQLGNPAPDGTVVELVAKYGIVPRKATAVGGNFTFSYEAPNITMTDTLTATAGGVEQQTAIVVGPGLSNFVHMTANPSSLMGDGQSVALIEGLVYDQYSNLVADGTPVHLTLTGPGSLASATVTTSQGRFSVEYTAGSEAAVVRIDAVTDTGIHGWTSLMLFSPPSDVWMPPPMTPISTPHWIMGRGTTLTRAEPVSTPLPPVVVTPGEGFSIPFRDLGGYAWASSAVEQMRLRGIIKGVALGQFSPAGTLNRAEFVAMTVRALGLNDKTVGLAFNDVSPTDWFAASSYTAARAGLVDGVTGNFNGYRPMPRQEMAQLMVRALEIRGKDTHLTSAEEARILSTFRDQSLVVAEYRRSVAVAVKYGLLQGQGDGRFAPRATLTRAEAAVVLSRLIGALR